MNTNTKELARVLQCDTDQIGGHDLVQCLAQIKGIPLKLNLHINKPFSPLLKESILNYHATIQGSHHKQKLELEQTS